MSAHVIAVARSGTHTFSKPTVDAIRLLTGLGIEGDAHLGETVKHRSRVRVDPTRPNLRQVHLIHTELLGELRTRGFDLAPGEIGENITTSGVDLLALPQDARLLIGPDAVIEIKGLRNPCKQLDAHATGLTAALLDRDAQGGLIRKSGVMGIVIAGGTVKPGDAIRVVLPAGPPRWLDVV